MVGIMQCTKEFNFEMLALGGRSYMYKHQAGFKVKLRGGQIIYIVKNAYGHTT